MGIGSCAVTDSERLCGEIEETITSSLIVWIKVEHRRFEEERGYRFPYGLISSILYLVRLGQLVSTDLRF